MDGSADKGTPLTDHRIPSAVLPLTVPIPLSLPAALPHRLFLTPTRLTIISHEEELCLSIPHWPFISFLVVQEQ